MTLKWEQPKYGDAFYLQLPVGNLGVVRKSVSRDAPESEQGYTVIVFGKTLKLLSKDAEDSKRRAILFAKKILKESFDILDRE